VRVDASLQCASFDHRTGNVLMSSSTVVAALNLVGAATGQPEGTM
jgi:hypothetical protein